MAIQVAVNSAQIISTVKPVTSIKVTPTSSSVIKATALNVVPKKIQAAFLPGYEPVSSDVDGGTF
jgi:hypothetical protein